MLLMALFLTTSIASQGATLAAGTFDGHALIEHANCSITGAGPGRTIIRPDGTYNTMFRAVANRGSLTVSNLTIDVRGRADLSAAFEINEHLPIITATNVEILGLARGCLAVDNRGAFTGSVIRSEGDGASILHRDTATACTIDGWQQVGGQYVFQNTTGAGISLTGIGYRGDYFQTPTYEAVTATAYDAYGADVVSHVVANRSSGDIIRHLSPVLTYDAERTLRSPLVRYRDRIEVASTAWTWVREDGTADQWRAWGSWRPTTQPSGTATVYRLTLGRLVHAPLSTRVALWNGTVPVAPRWRYVDGSTAPTPTTAAGTRLDIIRGGDPAGAGTRDTDTGAINLGNTSVNASLRNSSFVGGASDQVTASGVGTVIENCYTAWGYDEGFTIRGTDGRVTVRRCQAEYTGRTGFHLNDGPSDLYSCTANYNGTINDGSGDYGASTTSACAGSTMQVRGTGNLDGLFGGLITEATPGGFDKPQRNRSRSYRYRGLR